MTETAAAHVALVGRPNVGKSTIFNALTGLTQHTGNWPGKTVELAQGWLKTEAGRDIRLVDLPGTYSIADATAADGTVSRIGVDEAVARDYVLEQQPHLLVAVVNASALEQDLYLIGQLKSLPVPKLMVANMVDVLERRGLKIDYDLLSKRLGMPVVPVSALRREDLGYLQAAIARSLASIEGDGVEQPPMPGTERSAPASPAATAADEMIPHPSPDDPAALHAWVTQILDGVLRRGPARTGADDFLDHYLTHPIIGLLALLAILGIVFAITFGLGTPLQGLLEDGVVRPVMELTDRLLAGGPTWLARLVVDGILGGGGIVVTFLPILALFFAALALLEDSGYMARATVVMDRFMHLIGLHGKSFMPLFLGFGCNVPAVMGARTIESPRGRILVTILIPLVPCAARMAVLNFVAAAFFGARATLVVWSMVTLSMFTVMAVGVILSRTILHDPDSEELLMELPAYHLPNIRTTVYLIWYKLKSFLSKAGTVIVVASAVLWAAGYFPNGTLETSYLARLGYAIEPFGLLAGLDWRLLLATFASFIAKENALAALAVLYGANGAAGSLAASLAAQVSVPSALSFLVMLMLFIPCVATVAVIRQELRSTKWTAFVLGLLFAISFGAAALTYRIALALM